MISLKILSQLPIHVLRDQLTFGFELETQATQGFNRSDLKPNEDEIRELAREQADDITNDPTEWPDYLDRNDLGPATQYMTIRWYNMSKQLMAAAETLGCDSLSQAEKVGLIHDADTVLEHIYGSIIEDNWESIESDPADLFSVPQGIRAMTDESVEGFEFTTDGPVSYNKFNELSAELFAMDHDVDYSCSFHIHIGLKSLNATNRLYDHWDSMHDSLIKYICRNYHKLPKSQQLRGMKKDGLSSYTSRYGKDGMIIYHRGYDTIEFRLFGNIDNADDAKKCLDMAVEALQYALRCNHRRSPKRDGKRALHSSDAILYCIIGQHLKDAIKVRFVQELWNEYRQEQVRKAWEQHSDIALPWTKVEPTHQLILQGDKRA